FTNANRFGAGRGSERLELARRFGVQSVWDVGNAPLDAQLAADVRFDCVIECTGQAAGWQQAFERTSPGGQALLFGGLPRGTVYQVDSYRLHYEEIRVLGSFHFSPRDVVQARDLLLSGNLDLDALVSGWAPLAELGDALQRLQRGQGLQYAIDP